MRLPFQVVLWADALELAAPKPIGLPPLMVDEIAEFGDAVLLRECRQIDPWLSRPQDVPIFPFAPLVDDDARILFQQSSRRAR